MNMTLKTSAAALLLAFLLAGRARAVTPEVEKYDDNSYGSVVSTSGVVYLGHCHRGQFDPYEWSTWEGDYEVKAYVKAIAAVTVKRGKTELLGMNITPYIETAVPEAAKLGGNFVCYAGFKKNKKLGELNWVQFTVYRQIFISGNPNLQAFCQDAVAKSVPMKLKSYQDGSAFQGVQATTSAATAPAATPSISFPSLPPVGSFGTLPSSGPAPAPAAPPVVLPSTGSAFQTTPPPPPVK